MSICNICPAECGVDRNVVPGRCGLKNIIRVARAMPHFYEEPCISGKNGSGAIFFSGCNLSCVYCQNAEISKFRKGIDVSVDELTDIFNRLADSGVHNINLVTATHFTPFVVRALERFKKRLPVVWNSSGYEKVNTLKMLDGLVDIYLPDFKYGDSVLAERYSFAPDYFEHCCKAIDEMFRQTGKFVMGNDDVLKSGMLIRHLVLPDAYENTRIVLDYISSNFKPGDILFSLMGQYTPMPQTVHIPPLNRKLSQAEYNWAVGYMRSCDLSDGFTQDLSSSGRVYVPEFDLSGVMKIYEGK